MGTRDGGVGRWRQRDSLESACGIGSAQVTGAEETERAIELASKVGAAGTEPGVGGLCRGSGVFGCRACLRIAGLGQYASLNGPARCSMRSRSTEPPEFRLRAPGARY